MMTIEPGLRRLLSHCKPSHVWLGLSRSVITQVIIGLYYLLYINTFEVIADGRRCHDTRPPHD
jgi:hypothetical protein